MKKQSIFVWLLAAVLVFFLYLVINTGRYYIFQDIVSIIIRFFTIPVIYIFLLPILTIYVMYGFIQSKYWSVSEIIKKAVLVSIMLGILIGIILTSIAAKKYLDCKIEGCGFGGIGVALALGLTPSSIITLPLIFSILSIIGSLVGVTLRKLKKA